MLEETIKQELNKFVGFPNSLETHELILKELHKIISEEFTKVITIDLKPIIQERINISISPIVNKLENLNKRINKLEKTQITNIVMSILSKYRFTPKILDTSRNSVSFGGFSKTSNDKHDIISANNLH